ncbi:MAG: PEGA domain-containing protein [Deltaproteobacteria bacterium]|nr:PEGA domain-containing protein [Deltaproteobacteria bacterium]
MSVIHSAMLLVLGCSVFGSGCAEEKAAPPTEEAAEAVEIVLKSEPPGAAVLLSGRDRLGETPLTLRRHAGDRLRLHFVKEGHRTSVREIFLEGGVKQSFIVKLRPDAGTIIVDTGIIRGAKVFLDGTYRGRSPVRLEATLGGHLLRIEKDGAVPFEKQIRIEKAGQQVRVMVPVTPKKMQGKKKKRSQRKSRSRSKRN